MHICVSILYYTSLLHTQQTREKSLVVYTGNDTTAASCTDNSYATDNPAEKYLRSGRGVGDGRSF